MKRYIFLVPLFSVVCGFCFPSMADSYDDKCVAASSDRIPQRAVIQSVETTKASSELMRSHMKDTTMHWTKVTFHFDVVDRHISQSFLCALNKLGSWYIFPIEE
jgi:hypothetical protein